ncbi:putative transcriptional regulatory protein (GntR family, N-term) with a PLP-dependent aminotransferase domain (C-term) [Bradyrhizobium sp. ORS 375]|uniref:aminotransferase-like domain-containing protein n=1 Tax=Bradyrhizobium sp. (strain ORS 375) TaxID=566679 RepID=UPI0002406EB1|nr:PLP-dependent aminotransferase family protein [Bradyrhizobium sp. ORS 375]CCD92509.1 putative transcriptional regulatory protein (GntR family, N-term) with a PLP-dependent aminotransferase domain (C-term) [Bradyrhizobium sp. ORS 375]
MSPTGSDTRAAGVRTTAVADAIRQRLKTRVLVPGQRLPSIRAFATTMGVAPATVVEAYDRLAAEGIIRARRGSGFYVTETAQSPLALAELEPRRPRAIDPFWVSRQSLDADAGTLTPGCGWLPADWMPQEGLRRAVRALARSSGPGLTHYSPARGSAALRRVLQGRLAGIGIEASGDRLLLTSSGTQAIDLICRMLLRPGDTVVVDDPCYFNFLALLRAHQARIVSVPMTPNGPDIAQFEAMLAAERPRLYITNSGLHNPTGATLSLQTAHRLLNAAAAHDMIIIEDDIYGDFEPEPSPRLAALDGLTRVILIGSFSKTLSASIRCGYIAARADWIEPLIDLQIATGFGGPGQFAAETLTQVLTGGSYRKHVEELRARLARARPRVAARLQRLGITPWLMPRGGFHLWCRLPDGCTAIAVAQAALADDVVLAPGDVFSAAQSAATMMRFNVAHCDDQRVMAALERAVKR